MSNLISGIAMQLYTDIVCNCAIKMNNWPNNLQLILRDSRTLLPEHVVMHITVHSDSYQVYFSLINI